MKPYFLAVIASLVLIPVAHAGVISKVPFVITKPGKYFLTKNLTPSPKATAELNAAITVQASNVELDLGGFSVIANPDNATITTGITIGASDDVRVRNGSVSGFALGLQAGNDNHRLVLEDLRISSPTQGASLTSKGTLIRACAFILTTDTGTGLAVSSSGGGPAHVIERCTFYTTVSGVAGTQKGLNISGGAPTVVRDCQFFNWGQGILGNNATAIANNLFEDCGTTFTNVTTAGFNQ